MKKTILFLVTLVTIVTYSFAQTPGTIDNTFNTGTGPNAGVRAIALQSDGKILIGGNFTSFNGTANINRIARLNSSGSIDAGFTTGTGADNTVYAIGIQSTGKIIIAGNFMNYNGTSKVRIARLNTNGTLDNTFNPGTSADGIIRSIAIQSDDKIIIVGSFNNFNGTARNNIARLNADGSLDTGYDPGTGTNALIYTVKLQSDGKALIGGLFTTYNGTARACIARVNTNGSLDSGFDPGTGCTGGASPVVNAIDISSAGKIIIAGAFNSYNGTTRNKLALLNSNGSLDMSFNPNQGPSSGVNGVAIQPDGKVLLTGTFNSYDGNSRNYIVRTTATGSIDFTFSIGTGMSDLGYTVVFQSDGKALIGGEQMNYNGTSRPFVTRVNAYNITGIYENLFNTVSIYPNPTTGVINIKTPEKLNNISVCVSDITGKIILNNTVNFTDIINLNISTHPAGLYFVTLTYENNKKTFKIIKD